MSFVVPRLGVAVSSFVVGETGSPDVAGKASTRVVPLDAYVLSGSAWVRTDGSLTPLQFDSRTHPFTRGDPAPGIVSCVFLGSPPVCLLMHAAVYSHAQISSNRALLCATAFGSAGVGKPVMAAAPVALEEGESQVTSS